MAAPITVTDERIVEAGRRLLAEKKLITGWTLRSVVGTGKASRLAAVWAACAEVEAADKVELASPPLPDALEEQAKALPSVLMKMRHLPPGSLDPKVRKDYLIHADASYTERRRAGYRHGQRPEADGCGGTRLDISRIIEPPAPADVHRPRQAAHPRRDRPRRRGWWDWCGSAPGRRLLFNLVRLASSARRRCLRCADTGQAWPKNRAAKSAPGRG